MRKITKIDFNLNNADISPLPYSDTLEQNILSAILNTPDEFFPIAIKYLKPKGMFYNEFNAEIWDTIIEASQSKQLNAGYVLGVYEGRRNNERTTYLRVVLSIPTLPSEFLPNCLKLNEFFISRTLHRMGHYVNQKALTMDALELLGIVSDSTDKIYRHISSMRESTKEDSLKELAQSLFEIQNSRNGLLGTPFTIKELNRVTKGKRKGNFIVIGASTGEGKTTLEVQEMREAIEKGIPVGCLSLEMTAMEIYLMMACNKLKISLLSVVENTVSADDMTKISYYMESIKKLPIFISDTPAMKIGEIKSKARMWKKHHDIQELYIDHIHLVEGDVIYPNAEQKFTDISNQIKALAKELNIPIIALGQLSRKEKGSKSTHVISDLKYAGGIEQAADMIILIFRPEVHGIETLADGSSSEGYASLIVGKLRLLPPSNVRCHFDGMGFVDWDEWQYGKTKTVPQEYDNPYAGISGYQSNPQKLPENFFNEP